MHQYMPKISSLDSISEISKAWNYDVTEGTIRKSYPKAGFFITSENWTRMDDCSISP